MILVRASAQKERRRIVRVHRSKSKLKPNKNSPFHETKFNERLKSTMKLNKKPSMGKKKKKKLQWSEDFKLAAGNLRDKTDLGLARPDFGIKWRQKTKDNKGQEQALGGDRTIVFAGEPNCFTPPVVSRNPTDLRVSRKTRPLTMSRRCKSGEAN